MRGDEGAAPAVGRNYVFDQRRLALAPSCTVIIALQVPLSIPPIRGCLRHKIALQTAPATGGTGPEAVCWPEPGALGDNVGPGR